MSLDYKYTCPEIDENISDFTIECNDFARDMIRTFKELAENVRTCNSNLRSQADDQIDELEAELNSLKNYVIELEQRINELEMERI